MKMQHLFQRNLRQPLCRLPVDALVKCLSFVPAIDQLSIIRVCRHLRTHVTNSPSLWTRVDQIHHPTALSFVLECAQDEAVDITNLRVGPNNDQLRVVAAHMRHIRALDLYTDHSLETDAHTAFSTPAPLLQQLSIRGSGYHSITVDYGSLIASNYPRLSHFQTNWAGLDGSVCTWLPVVQSLPTLHTFSFDFADVLEDGIVDSFAILLPRVARMNIRLRGWGLWARSPFRPTLHRINICWTKPGPFVPSDTIPDVESWNSIRVIHIAHVSDSPGGPSQANLTGGNFPIAAQAIPYRRLWVRASGERVHLRVVHQDERERVFCGLHPTTVSGLAARIPGLELTALTVATTAVALDVLAGVPYPALRRIRLVLDSRDNDWINIFARDMLNVPMLEHLELSIDMNVIADWTTAMILRVIGSCMAAGHSLQRVAFLGFTPDSRCTTQVEAFADDVVVDRNWHEPASERVWFTEPAFEW